MMHSSVEVLSAYSTAFKDLLNDKVWSRDKSIRQLLRLNKDDDWNFVCAAMDVVEDSCNAGSNFLRFGLDGPARYDDLGEKYLRLYGILNATYIQQEAVLKLYGLANVPHLKEAQSRLGTLKIREVRHKLGAHSTDYLNMISGQVESYVPVQATLGGFSCEYFNNKTLSSQRVDLRECLDEHFQALLGLMDKIYEKTVRTLFKGQTKKREEYMGKLNDLRIMKAGGLVIKLPEGEKVVIRTMTAKLSSRKK